MGPAGRPCAAEWLCHCQGPAPSKPSLSAGLHRRLRIARADATATQLGALQLRLRVVFHIRTSDYFDPNCFRRKGGSGYSQRRALSSRGRPSKEPEHAPSESGPHSESRGGMLRALAQPPDWPSAAARGSSRATACPADRQRRFRFGHTGRARIRPQRVLTGNRGALKGESHLR